MTFEKPVCKRIPKRIMDNSVKMCNVRGTHLTTTQVTTRMEGPMGADFNCSHFMAA